MDLEKTLKDALIGKRFGGWKGSYMDTSVFYFGKVTVTDWYNEKYQVNRQTRSAEYELRSWAADWETNRDGKMSDFGVITVTDVSANLVLGEGYHLTVYLSDGQIIFFKPDADRLPGEQDDLDDWSLKTPSEYVKVGPFSKIERIPR